MGVFLWVSYPWKCNPESNTQDWGMGVFLWASYPCSCNPHPTMQDFGINLLNEALEKVKSEITNRKDAPLPYSPPR